MGRSLHSLLDLVEITAGDSAAGGVKEGLLFFFASLQEGAIGGSKWKRLGISKALHASARNRPAIRAASVGNFAYRTPH